MRKVFNSHRELAQVWAAQTHPEGRASSMGFFGPNIYSWGMHYCIASFHSPSVVVFTSEKVAGRRSVSTGQHTGHARNALRNKELRVVYARSPTDNPTENKMWAGTAIRNALEDADLPRIRQPRRDASNALALSIAEEFNTYLEAVQPGGDITPFPTESTQALRDYFTVQTVIGALKGNHV